MTSDPFITLAVVTSPHGVSGRVKVKSFANPPESFAVAALTDEMGNPVSIRITSGEGTVFVCAIDGLKRREDAEIWRNRKLGVTRSELPDTREEGEFYISDLEGCAVETEDGKPFGVVKGVYNFGAGDILEITKADGGEEMFSFTHVNFPAIDVPNQRLVIAPPEVITGKEHD